jgi:hypothetical protein
MGRFHPYPVDPEEEEKRRGESLRRTGRPPERAKHSPLALWIERGSLLLRRLEEQTQFENFHTARVTSYEPAFDVTITENELRFDSPLEPLS